MSIDLRMVAVGAVLLLASSAVFSATGVGSLSAVLAGTAAGGTTLAVARALAERATGRPPASGP
jgi:hypothetical protein